LLKNPAQSSLFPNSWYLVTHPPLANAEMVHILYSQRAQKISDNIKKSRYFVLDYFGLPQQYIELGRSALPVLIMDKTAFRGRNKRHFFRQHFQQR